MRVLVTGSAGFIGSATARELALRGHEVIGLDNLSTGHRSNLPSNLWGKFHEGDVTNCSDVRKAISGCDAVIHLAAMISVPESIQDPDECERVNVGGTETIVDIGSEEGVKRFVIPSSSAVYGNTDIAPTPEDSTLAPMSPYAESKLAAEKVVEAVGGIALRYFNVYGPRQDPASPYAAVVPLFIRAIAHGEPITIYGDGEQTRDFVFVEDVARVNVDCVERDIPPGALNVGSSLSVSINDLAKLIASAIGVGLDIRYEDPREGDVLHSRSHRYVGATPISIGLLKTIQWHRGLL